MVTSTGTGQSIQESRPVILNRPFRSVAELGYVCRGTPWGNLNMTFPESGDTALLDVFCINEPQNANALVAGRVDVNTRQPFVLQALIAGALSEDELNQTSATMTTAAAQAVSKLLYNRTTSTDKNSGPLANRAELVGRYIGTSTPANVTDPNPDNAFTGLAYDIGTDSAFSGTPAALIPRLRLATMRALGDATTARTWNLMIDIVAQSGRYPTNNPSNKLANFVVDGERRYWLHVAIDRYTGQVIDAQYEPVNE